MDLDLDAALCRATAYKKLSPDDRCAVASIAEVRSYERGAVIAAEDTPADFFFTIVSGRVKVHKTKTSGKEVILGIFGPGEEVGAVAVLEERTYPANVGALEPTVCLRIRADRLFKLLDQRPTLVRGLLLGLARRVLELTRRVGDLTGARVEYRLAGLLCRLAAETGRPEGAGTFVPMTLSRQELADMAGTTIETCIRVMSAWKKQRIVSTQAEGFLILDPDALGVLAEH